MNLIKKLATYGLFYKTIFNSVFEMKDFNIERNSNNPIPPRISNVYLNFKNNKIIKFARIKISNIKYPEICDKSRFYYNRNLDIKNGDWYRDNTTLTHVIEYRDSNVIFEFCVFKYESLHGGVNHNFKLIKSHEYKIVYSFGRKFELKPNDYFILYTSGGSMNTSCIITEYTVDLLDDSKIYILNEIIKTLVINHIFFSVSTYQIDSILCRDF